LYAAPHPAATALKADPTNGITSEKPETGITNVKSVPRWFWPTAHLPVPVARLKVHTNGTTWEMLAVKTTNAKSAAHW
jgi:hypothetical protein